MRLLLFAIATLALSSCDSLNEEYEERKWITYTALDKKFSVEIPEGYDSGTIKHSDDFIGKYEESYIEWRFPSSWIPDFDIKMMSVSYINIPVKMNNKQQAFDYLNNKIVGGLDPKNTKTIKNNISVNGFKGQKYRFDYESSVFYLWTYLVGSRIYIFKVSVYNSYNDTAEIERVFTSFKAL